MGTIVLIALTAAIINNFVLYYFLGICPFIGVSRQVSMAVGMGLAVTFVMTVSATVTWVINNLILAAGAPLVIADLSFIKYVIFIMVIAGMVQLVEMYVRKFYPGLYKSFGIFLPLITTNCSILGCCLLVDLDKNGWFALAQAGPIGLLHTIVFALAAGGGFALAITLMAGIREELDVADVPRPLRGAGITLLVAGILAMAFMGFAGMGR